VDSDQSGQNLTHSPRVGYNRAPVRTLIAAKKAKISTQPTRIRKALLEAGIGLEDTAQGTGWRWA